MLLLDVNVDALVHLVRDHDRVAPREEVVHGPFRRTREDE